MNAQILTDTHRQNHLIQTGKGKRIVSLVQIDEPGQLLTSGDHIQFFGLSRKTEIHTALMVEHEVISLCHHIAEFLTVFFCEGIPEINRHVIACDFGKLLRNNIHNGIPQTETGQKQRGTAADADEHHGKPLAVTEDIADGYLVQETELLPQGQMFQQDFFAGIRSLGANQLGRLFFQGFPAAVPGNGEHQCGIYQDDGKAQRPVDGQQEIRLDIEHDFVCFPDNHGDHGTAQKQAKTAAEHGAAAGIDQIFAHDFSIGVTQGFQRSDLGTFFINHAGHGGDAHQGSHQQEKHRQNPGNTGHNVGTAVQIAVTNVAGSAEHNQIRAVHAVNFLTGIFQLQFGILQFCFCIGNFLFCFQFSFLVVSPAFRDFIPGLAPQAPVDPELVFGIVQTGGLLLEDFSVGADLLESAQKCSFRRLQLGQSAGSCGVIGVQRGQHVQLGRSCSMNCPGGLKLCLESGNQFRIRFCGRLCVGKLILNGCDGTGGCGNTLTGGIIGSLDFTAGHAGCAFHSGNTGLGFRDTGPDSSQIGLCLRLTGFQLGNGGINLLFSVFDLIAGVYQLLAVGFQFRFRVRQFLVGICKFFLGFGLFFFKFRQTIQIFLISVCIFRFRLFLDIQKPLQGEFLGICFQGIQCIFQIGMIGVGENVVFLFQGQMNFGIVICIKGTGGNIVEVLQRAAANGSGSPVHVQIEGTGNSSHHGKGFAAEAVQ